MDRIIMTKISNFYGDQIDGKIVQETRNGREVIQVYGCDEEDGFWEPYATLSRSVVSSDKDQTTFVLKDSPENIPTIRGLYRKGILKTKGSFASICWKE